MKQVQGKLPQIKAFIVVSRQLVGDVVVSSALLFLHRTNHSLVKLHHSADPSLPLQVV